MWAISASSTEFVDLGQRLVAKAMDDRIGCVAVDEAPETDQRTQEHLYFVFTAQEEVGLRGARTSAYRIDPIQALPSMLP